MDKKNMTFKVEKKSRMTPEYSVEAMESEISQRYENARTLEEAAQQERARARALEKILQDIRNNEINDISYINVNAG